jgi:hypothetical protein
MPQLINMLISYSYWNDNIAKTIDVKNTRLLIDSGAFTAWKKGDEIQLDDYCAFLKDLPIKPWRYFSLDVVGDADKSMKNYLTMKDRGFDPIPVFTRGANIKDFITYLKTSEIIGIGGIANTPKALNFIEWLSTQTSLKKTHWLGVTTPRMLVRHNPFSADSSWWNNSGRYGEIVLYMGKGNWHRIRRLSLIDNEPSPLLRKVLFSYSKDWQLLQKEQTWRKGNFIRLISAQSFLRFSQEIQKKLGTFIFAAITDKSSTKQFQDAYSRESDPK